MFLCQFYQGATLLTGLDFVPLFHLDSVFLLLAPALVISLINYNYS